MDKILKEILEKQKIKIQLIDSINYNVYSNGQVIHPALGTILLVNKIKLNKKGTWLEFKGIHKDNPEKPIRFSINPKNLLKNIKVLEN